MQFANPNQKRFDTLTVEQKGRPLQFVFTRFLYSRRHQCKGELLDAHFSGRSSDLSHLSSPSQSSQSISGIWRKDVQLSGLYGPSNWWELQQRVLFRIFPWGKHLIPF